VGGSLANTGTPSAVASASYNANNQLTQFGSASLTYDANGNLTSDGTHTYTWDARNHLVSMSGSVSASFQYDPFGRRVSKTIGAATTNYLYDNVNPVQELVGGSPTANLLTGLGVDERFQRTDGSGAANFLTDALGSTIALYGQGGNTLAQYTYDPYGNTTATGSSLNPYQFTGRENDGTGLYYYRARYYSSALSRFISQDPVGFGGGDINAYTYVDNSPANQSDPAGLWSTGAHNQMIWNALHPCGVSDEDIRQIEQGSEYVDSLQFQGAEDAYMHAMRNGTNNQSVFDAMQQTSNFISAEMTSATSEMSAGDVSEAMFTFGMAMHPLMDVTSPAHTDANGNPIPWCGLSPWSCSNISQHDDLPGSIENVKRLNAHPEIQELENALMRGWFQLLTGRKLNRCSQ